MSSLHPQRARPLIPTSSFGRPAPPNGLEVSRPPARATVHSFSRNLAGKTRSNFPHASRVSRRPSTPWHRPAGQVCGLPALCRTPSRCPSGRHTWAGVLMHFQGCKERLCEDPEIANRVPTGGQDCAPAKHSGPTSVSIRASPKGQVPTARLFTQSGELLGSTEWPLPYPRKKPEPDPRRVFSVPRHTFLHHLLLVQDATR